MAEGQIHVPLNSDRTPPYKLAGVALAVVVAIVLTLTWCQFRGFFDTNAQLYVLASRSGLAMDPGSKVTYNGVPIGRVEAADAKTIDQATLVLNVDPQYLHLLPSNVDVKLLATTAFGNKYVSFTSPADPAPQRLKGGETIRVSKCEPRYRSQIASPPSSTPCSRPSPRSLSRWTRSS